MDASRNSARNELKEFSLKFINVLVNILASQWSRNDEGENRIDSNSKAVEHFVSLLGTETGERCTGSHRADTPPRRL